MTASKNPLAALITKSAVPRKKAVKTDDLQQKEKEEKQEAAQKAAIAADKAETQDEIKKIRQELKKHLK